MLKRRTIHIVNTHTAMGILAVMSSHIVMGILIVRNTITIIITLTMITIEKAN